MEFMKNIAPYIVSIITAIIAYCQAKKGFKVEIEKLETQHKNDLETLVKQHEIDIENLKQKHEMEKELKEKESKVPNTFSCFGTNSSAKDEIEAIFGDRTYFQTPKPLKLLKELVRATTNKDSTVLDFFAGSGTTGHAIIDLNKEDGGNRKYILISNNESNICREITLKRMKMFDEKVKFID